jgi:putative serine protease PepD
VSPKRKRADPKLAGVVACIASWGARGGAALCGVLGAALAGCSSSTSPTPAAKHPSSASGVPVIALPSSAAASSGAAVALQDDYVAVVKKILPSVVQIKTDVGLGSGVVFDKNGDIVTNDHVVADASSFAVTSSDGHQYTGSLKGVYPPDDLAVIHVDAPLPDADFGNSSQLQVGDIVMAVGNPLGLQSSVTAGIVSATGRTVGEGNGVVLPDTIQTSAEINPGNSGGALVDIAAQVVGIPTLAATDPQLGGSAPGIGFAIPSTVVVKIANQLVSQGRVTSSGRAYLGVTLASSFGGGAVISSVVPGGPAAKAGLSSGDLITAINGTSISTTEDVATVLADLAPGGKVTIAVTHQDGSQATVALTLGELPG